MLFDFLFVTGDPFGVVLVLREIDAEFVFSHCVRRCVDVYYNANIYVYIIYQYIQYSKNRITNKTNVYCSYASQGSREPSSSCAYFRPFGGQ